MSKRWSLYVRQMGPPWIISAVACGPATLASVCIAGASYGFDLLRVVILSAVFGTTAQYLAAKIGITGGKGNRYNYRWAEKSIPQGGSAGTNVWLVCPCGAESVHGYC